MREDLADGYELDGCGAFGWRIVRVRDGQRYLVMYVCKPHGDRSSKDREDAGQVETFAKRIVAMLNTMHRTRMLEPSPWTKADAFLG